MFEVFQIGPFFVWAHVVFLLLGAAMATEFLFRLADRAHLSLQHFRDHAFRYLLAYLIGARLIAVIAEYRVYFKDPLRFFIVWDGNFSFLGGTIGVGIILWIATLHHRSTFLQWLDVLVPATTFGLIFDWVGRFASGKSYGLPTDVPWGVTYDTLNVRYAVPIHPVQLYYVLFYAILTLALLVIRKNARRAGAETLVGIVVASVGTMLLEFCRGDFGIPVFAKLLDFFILIALFLSLGILASIELRLSKRGMMIYGGVLFLGCLLYILLRSWIPSPAIELRFSQFLALLALLITVVYVVVQRQKHPHL
ncbi:hypothetical protein A2635_04690 [Candidatus Peribacteria bacterium RIFCSPHIGHO2_01_FULL_51_9]|nr:MAG: hypothetical protein A2635_04690 [Candidatus Peribacteria bacterium RIFCSPHIGHO2_01_FULL_51_9]